MKRSIHIPAGWPTTSRSCDWFAAHRQADELKLCKQVRWKPSPVFEHVQSTKRRPSTRQLECNSFNDETNSGWATCLSTRSERYAEIPQWQVRHQDVTGELAPILGDRVNGESSLSHGRDAKKDAMDMGERAGKT